MPQLALTVRHSGVVGVSDEHALGMYSEANQTWLPSAIAAE